MLRFAYFFGLALFSLCACNSEFPASTQNLQSAEQAFDAELLVRSLDKIEAWHIENDTGVAGSLGAGRSISSIVEQFAGTACTPTEEMQAIWSWHDGAISPVPFAWYHDFLPVDEALSEYKSLLLNPLVPWDPRFFPIFSFEGEWYATYCGKGARSAGPVMFYFLEDGPRVTFLNLTTYAATMAEALESGAVRFEKGAMVEDIQAVRLIHQKYNPDYEFPYYVPDGP